MSEECELCKLDRINHVFYNCDDFIIISCDSCNVPMEETRKMNAKNQQNLKEILKEVGSKSLLIIENNRNSKNENWELAVKINRLCKEAFKALDTYPNRDEIAQSKDWGEYADCRKRDLN